MPVATRTRKKATKKVAKKTATKKTAVKKKSRKQLAIDAIYNIDNIEEKDIDKKKLEEATKAVQFLMSKDPTSSNKYLLWMATQKKTGYNNEDIVATVQSFNRRSSTLKHSDIYKYDDLKVLEEEILALTPSKAERKYLKNLKVGVDYVTLIENDTFRLYYVTSFKGCKNVGKGTRWCIVANASYWKQYNASNDVFVVVDAKNEENKYAVLRSSNRYNQGHYTLYNKDDRSINLDYSFSPILVDEIKEKINLILMINGKKVNTPARASSRSNYVLFSPNDSKPASKRPITNKVKELAKEVKALDLLAIMPFSNNEALIRHLKKDIKTKMGKVKFNQNYTLAFLKVFKEEFGEGSVLNLIKAKPLTKTKLKQFEFAIKDMTKAEFTKLLKETKYKQTRTSLIKYHTKYCDIVDKKDVTQAIANQMIAAQGEKALPKVYHLYGKRNYSYYSSYESKLTKAIKKMKISMAIGKQVMNQKDCPRGLVTLLEDKLNIKMLTPKEYNTVNNVITEFLKNKQSKKEINVTKLKKFLKDKTRGLK